MTHKIEIVWHDLVEDPNDLPKKDGAFWFIIRKRDHSEDDVVPYFSYMLDDCVASYDVDNRVWEESWDNGYGDYGGTVYWESYGTPRKPGTSREAYTSYMFPPESYAEELYSDEYVVVAWADFPDVYEPSKGE